MREPVEPLIQRVLEGSATPAERERFEAMAAADPALRRRREELEHVFQLLGSARMVPAPEGLRDAVMQAIGPRPAAAGSAAPARAGRVVRGAFWPRLLLPVAATLAAVVLLWVARPPAPGERGGVSGTIGGRPETLATLVGEGPSALQLGAEAVPLGFRLDLRAGDTPGTIEITPLVEGVSLGRAAGAATGPGGSYRQPFAAGARWQLEARAAPRVVPLRIVVRYVGGREATATCRVPARRPTGPGG